MREGVRNSSETHPTRPNHIRAAPTTGCRCKLNGKPPPHPISVWYLADDCCTLCPRSPVWFWALRRFRRVFFSSIHTRGRRGTDGMAGCGRRRTSRSASSVATRSTSRPCTPRCRCAPASSTSTRRRYRLPFFFVLFRRSAPYPSSKGINCCGVVHAGTYIFRPILFCVHRSLSSSPAMLIRRPHAFFPCLL